MMNRKEYQESRKTELEQNLQTITMSKAKDTNDIKPLLRHWLSFRLYIVFKSPYKTSRWLYGNEHRCTYNQCLHGKVPNIVLRKSKGYTDLIRLVEKEYKGKYQSATIYGRNAPGGPFDEVCRRYYQGTLQDKNDPLLSDDEGLTLYYSLKEGKLVISETEQKEDYSNIDFKSEIAMHLKK
jgi:hypothetical protein